MKTLNSLRKDEHVGFCPSPDTGEAALPTNSSDATLDDIYLMLPENHIRLLRLQKPPEDTSIKDGSGLLQCELAVFSLESVPSFVALSYCWGDLATTYPLHCMGQELEIHQNLHAVLMRLQAVGFRDWLWIDAVCINQRSDEEKNHQIPLMKNIFSQAHMVIGWLGEAPDGLHESWEIIQRLPEALGGVKGTEGPVHLDLQCPSESSERLWPILIDVFGRPFFRRLWIAQEVVIPREVSLLCGDLLFTWTDLISIARAIVDIQLWTRGWLEVSPGAKLAGNCATIYFIDSVREGFHLGLFTSSQLIKTALVLEATDLKDKVYGLLGLVPLSIQDEIKVDVGKSIVAVYTDFSRSLLKYGESVETLIHAGISKSAIADLPSWCIDFSNEYSPITAFWVSCQAGRGPSLSPCIEYLDVASTEPLLTLSGWTVDSIAEVAEGNPYWLWNDCDTEEIEAVRNWDEGCLQISRTIYNTPDDIPDQHWRTITSDYRRDKKGNRREEYLKWRQSLRGNSTPSPDNQEVNSFRSHPRTLWSDFDDDVNQTCVGNRFYSTKGGRIGVGPPDARPGDFVCIPCQSRVPYIMRKNDANGRYKLLGDTYCFGVMYGEIFDMGAELKAMEVRFVIE